MFQPLLKVLSSPLLLPSYFSLPAPPFLHFLPSFLSSLFLPLEIQLGFSHMLGKYPTTEIHCKLKRSQVLSPCHSENGARLDGEGRKREDWSQGTLLWPSVRRRDKENNDIIRTMSYNSAGVTWRKDRTDSHRSYSGLCTHIKAHMATHMCT